MEIVTGAMATPCGEWRIECIRHGLSRWYRIVYRERILADRQVIASVQRILHEQGVDIADLVEVKQPQP